MADCLSVLYFELMGAGLQLLNTTKAMITKKLHQYFMISLFGYKRQITISYSHEYCDQFNKF